MRSQLLVAGAFAIVLGILFYVLELPVFFAWSFPFIVGGGVMMLLSPFLKEGEGPLTPPEGYRFCVFCSSLVALGAERCGHCAGRQPPFET